MRKKHGGKRKWKPSTRYASPVDERTKNVRNGEDWDERQGKEGILSLYEKSKLELEPHPELVLEEVSRNYEQNTKGLRKSVNEPSPLSPTQI
jgi:hypothetical protein